MELSVFTVKLFVLFIPGLISFISIDNLTIHKATKQIHWFIYSIILSFISYFIFILGQYLVSIVIPFYQFDIKSSFFYQLLAVNDINLSYSDVLISSIIAVIIGGLVSRLIANNSFFKFCYKKRLTSRHGYADTLSYMFELYPFKYITIKDWRKRLVIIGELVAMSEVTDVRNEIVLQECSVYDLDSYSLLYNVPVFYLSMNFDDITIEIMNGEI